jgi:hypothetical protein
MKRISIIVASCLVVGVVGTSSALADDTPSPDQVAGDQCVAQQHAMGVKAFKALYGKRAMQTCKGKSTGAANALVSNAAQQCKAEQADPNFAAAHGGQTFDQSYGTNPNDKNSFGKCVSSKAKTQQAEQTTQLNNAAQACRAERSDSGFPAAHGGKSFADFYGTNHNKRNAFGKCVSGKVKKAPAPTPTA